MIPVDKAEVAVIHVVGLRLKDARNLCGFTQKSAAELLDIDLDFLKLVEIGLSIDSIPLKLIHRASVVYDVSTDYLFGFSEDWENSEDVKHQRNIGHWIYQVQLESFGRLSNKIVHQQRKIEALTNAVTQTLSAILETETALARFRELNPEYDGMRAGAMLVNRVETAKQAVEDAQVKLIWCKAIPRNKPSPDGVVDG